MVSVLHKELEYKVEKLKYKKLKVKNQHFQNIPVRSGMHGHISSSSYELLSAPYG